jgi:hypothetical protein
MITIITFLVLLYTSEKLVERAKMKSDANMSKSNLVTYPSSSSSSSSTTKDPQKQQQQPQQQQQ